MANTKAKNNRGLVDPVDGEIIDGVDGPSQDEIDGLDMNNIPDVVDGGLTPDEIGTLQDRRTSAPHPFDGYSLGRSVPLIDGPRVSSTYIVLLKHAEEPAPDVSNEQVSIPIGDPQSPGVKFRSVTLGTYHTRVVTNRRGNENIQVVFDREIQVGDTVYMCSIVPSHAARAQVCFYFDPDKGRVFVDRRYLLADARQSHALLRMFEAIYYQRTGAERAAKEFDAAVETTVGDR
jgi:hypothetical protein